MLEELLRSEIGSELGSINVVSCFLSESSCLSLQQHNRVGFSQDEKSKDGYNINLVTISKYCRLVDNCSPENSQQLR